MLPKTKKFPFYLLVSTVYANATAIAKEINEYRKTCWINKYKEPPPNTNVPNPYNQFIFNLISLTL